MATFKTPHDEREIPDGTKLEPVAEAMGVPFGCHNGVCGACTVIVLEGMENLGAMSEAEEDMDLDPDQRLMCQCTISGGTVTIEL
jgi:ferredoxin